MDRGSKIMDQRSKIMDQGSWIMDHGSKIMDHGSRILEWPSWKGYRREIKTIRIYYQRYIILYRFYKDRVIDQASIHSFREMMSRRAARGGAGGRKNDIPKVKPIILRSGYWQFDEQCPKSIAQRRLWLISKLHFLSSIRIWYLILFWFVRFVDWGGGDVFQWFLGCSRVSLFYLFGFLGFSESPRFAPFMRTIWSWSYLTWLTSFLGLVVLWSSVTSMWRVLEVCLPLVWLSWCTAFWPIIWIVVWIPCPLFRRRFFPWQMNLFLEKESFLTHVHMCICWFVFCWIL